VWGPAIVMVRIVCLSHANISETKRNRRHMVTRKRKWETGLPNLESAIRFAIEYTVSPFWVFLGWHFVNSYRNGPVWLVNVVNISVGTVTSRHHTWHITDDTLVLTCQSSLTTQFLSAVLAYYHNFFTGRLVSSRVDWICWVLLWLAS